MVSLNVNVSVNGWLSLCVGDLSRVPYLLPYARWDRHQPPCNTELDKRKKMDEEQDFMKNNNNTNPVRPTSSNFMPYLSHVNTLSCFFCLVLHPGDNQER